MGQSGQDEGPEASRNGVVLVVGLVAAAAAIVGLVFTMFKENGTYAKPVAALAAQRAQLVGKPVRAEGTLVHGSLSKRETGCEYRFRIRGEGDIEIPVRYLTCALPSDFHDKPDEDLDLTVEGRLLTDDSLEASNVLTKCPSKYDEAKKAGKKRPELMQF
jgi:cytochrome c-type biogenesis protein CcmE